MAVLGFKARPSGLWLCVLWTNQTRGGALGTAEGAWLTWGKKSAFAWSIAWASRFLERWGHISDLIGSRKRRIWAHLCLWFELELCPRLTNNPVSPVKRTSPLLSIPHAPYFLKHQFDDVLCGITP